MCTRAVESKSLLGRILIESGLPLNQLFQFVLTFWIMHIITPGLEGIPGGAADRQQDPRPPRRQGADGLPSLNRNQSGKKHSLGGIHALNAPRVR
jgi:hypothetical protein